MDNYRMNTVRKMGLKRVMVATLTRQRPQMLQALLRSWAELERPQSAEIHFLVVENDLAPESRNIVEIFYPHFTEGISYAHEPELGIPFGRNRAAREAIIINADILIFVDDDETVANDWLVRFLEGWRNSGAFLLGAPLRINPLNEEATLLERLMHRNIASRYRKKENRAKKLADLNDTRGVTVVTNNWLAEVDLFKTYDIWFDEKMRFTGGTDAKFYADVKEKKLATGWVRDAFVYETIPRQRLSFSYQYRRGRDQSNTNFCRKIAKNPRARYGIIISVPIRMLLVAALAIALPLTGGRTLLSLARGSGWIMGRIGAAFGKKSKLYLDVTGA